MDKRSDNDDNSSEGSSASPSSTTSLGKRRSLARKSHRSSSGRTRSRSPRQRQQSNKQTASPVVSEDQEPRSPGINAKTSTMSNPKSSDYGSQASPLRLPLSHPNDLVKVTILGAAGGIGQPLSMLLLLHSEYIQHVALYDLSPSVKGVAADVSHIDRQCKVTGHAGPEELAEAVRGAKVIVCPAGLAQKPGMSRDDLFGSNAKIMYNLARVCAQEAPEAMLAIISNPVNSLVPLVCEVYNWVLQEKQAAAATGTDNKPQKSEGKHCAFNDCFRRIFGVTTLDVIRSSTLSAKSALFKPESSGLFKDPANIQVPVVGGHAGRTIVPLLSQMTCGSNSKVDKKRLVEDKATTSTLIESVQQAGIEVLNLKKGAGSATLSMAYAACRFTISLLRAIRGEKHIVECAYVRHQQPVIHDLDYFATPLELGKDGYIKSLGLGKLMPFEQRMVDDAAKELKGSVAKGEDFAKEHLSSVN